MDAGVLSGIAVVQVGAVRGSKGRTHGASERALDGGDNRGIIRLGAAFAYLHAKEFDRAQRELNAIEANRDFFAEYLSDVLRLHLAVARKDEQTVETYAKKLDKVASLSRMIAAAVASLLSGKIANAFALEANLLLAVSPELRTAV